MFRAILLLLAAIAALFLPGCGTPLSESQKIQGYYVCKATGDQMIFTPDGQYRYTLNGTSDFWKGSYTYDSAPTEHLLADNPDAGRFYNREGAGLRFTYAVSSHCYIGSRPRWDNPRFTDPDRKYLVLVSDGQTRHYLRTRQGGGAQ